MAQAKTPKIKAAILQAWQDAQNEGITRTAFHERIKGTDLEITYGGLERWLKEVKKVGGVEPSKAYQTQPAILAATTLDDVEAAYKKSVEVFITNLEAQEQQLKGELERVIADLAKARDKLTKFD